MKKFTLFVLVLLTLSTIGAKAEDYSVLNTSNVTFKVGEKAYAEKVIIDGVTYDAVKLGTSKVVGDAAFTIPANTSKIHMHIAGWNGKESALVLSTDNSAVTITPSEITATSDEGISNNSPYTLKEVSKVATDYYHTVELTGVTGETTITATTVAGKSRVVIWGVNTEVAIADDATTYTITTAVNDETMGSVLGAGTYAEGSTVTLTAKANPGYEFVKWSNDSTTNPLKFKATADAELTAIFQEQEPITCAEVADLAIGDAFVLNEFTVTYVNGSYTYIKDETGYSLIYQSNFGLKAGDFVTGFAGVRADYNGLVQITPSVTKADLEIIELEAPQPEVMTENPTLEDMNKYVVFPKVTMTAGSINGSDTRSITGTLEEQDEEISFYNQWKYEVTFEEDKLYTIVGAVSTYKGNVQVNFISAVDYQQTITTTDATWAGSAREGYYITAEDSILGDVAIVLMEDSWTKTCMVSISAEGQVLAQYVTIENAPVVSEDGTLTLETVVLTETNEYILNVVAAKAAPIQITAEATMALSESEWEVGTMNIIGTWNGYDVKVQLLGWSYYGYGEYVDASIQITKGEGVNEEVYMWANATVNIEKKEDGSAVLTSAFPYYMDMQGMFNYELTITIAEAVEHKVEEIAVVCNNMKLVTEEFEDWDGTKSTIASLNGTCDLGEVKVELWYDMVGKNLDNLYGDWGYVEVNRWDMIMLSSSITVTIIPEAEGDEYVPSLELNLVEGTVATYTDGELDTFEGQFLSEDWKLYNLKMTEAGNESAVENITTTVVPVKVIENGQLIIIKNGVKYNVAGAVVK